MNDKFEKSRREDGSIDLVALYIEEYGNSTKSATAYLTQVEDVRLITSRQAAAIAIVSARFL